MEQLSFLGPAPPRRTVRRIFFALRPDADVNAAIDRDSSRWRRDYGFRGKPMAAERRHVSLIGVGEADRLPDGHIERLCRLADRVEASPFAVRFDRIIKFSGGAIVLVGNDGNPAILEFCRALAGVMPSHLRHPGSFSPHITVLRQQDALACEHAIDPLLWIIRQFYLIESLQGEGEHIERGVWDLVANGA